MPTTAILPPRYQESKVDVYLRIFRDGEFYGLEVLGTPRPIRSSINMTSNDLADLNKRLQESIDSIARNNEDEEPTDLELENLAKVGHNAFNRIFSDDIRNFIIQATTRNTTVYIHVVSENFFLPWELIYPNNILDEPLSFDNFWGMNHIISRTIIRNGRPGACVPPEISFKTLPKLGMLSYSGLPSVARELRFFQALASDHKLSLFELRSLDPDQTKEGFREFRRFWQNNLNLAHFACHAVYDSKNPTLSSIFLTKEFPISLEDIDTYQIEINGNPLIIMNACETGSLNFLFTSSFADTFLKYGARGVVATECTVPDDFAADFAEQLYSKLLKGEHLGESLLSTRRYFWENHSNPSALLYSMYAPPNIRIINSI